MDRIVTAIVVMLVALYIYSFTTIGDEAAYDRGYEDGVDAVLNDPQNYDLFNIDDPDYINSDDLWNNTGDYIDSIYDYVVEHPEEFDLYTQDQLEEMLEEERDFLLQDIAENPEAYE